MDVREHAVSLLALRRHVHSQQDGAVRPDEVFRLLPDPVGEVDHPPIHEGPVLVVQRHEVGRQAVQRRAGEDRQNARRQQRAAEAFFVPRLLVGARLACHQLFAQGRAQGEFSASNPAAFRTPYRISACPESVGKPRLDFRENQFSSFACNNIDFPVWASVISAQNPVPLPAQNLTCQTFSCLSDFLSVHFSPLHCNF